MVFFYQLYEYIRMIKVIKNLPNYFELLSKKKVPFNKNNDFFFIDIPSPHRKLISGHLLIRKFWSVRNFRNSLKKY